MTRREQKMRMQAIGQKGFGVCPECIKDSEEGRPYFWKGYRKHVIFDLLKERADLYYQKMLDRKLMEE